MAMLSVGVPGIRVISVTVDPPSIGAGTASNVDVTAPVDATDRVIQAEAPDALEAGLVPIKVGIPSANTIRIRLYNPTAAAIDGAARVWTFAILEG